MIAAVLSRFWTWDPCVDPCKASTSISRVFELLKVVSSKFPPKLCLNALLNSEQFVWSANAVDLSEVTYWFLVLLLGFLLVSIILRNKNRLSKPFAHESGSTFTFKILYLYTCITLERLYTSGSNTPPHRSKVQIPRHPSTDDSQLSVGCRERMLKQCAF